MKKLFFIIILFFPSITTLASEIQKKSFTNAEIIKLYDATCQDDAKTVSDLLKEGMSPTTPYFVNQTPLHRAAKYNCIAVLDTLLNHLDGDIDTYIEGEANTVMHAGLTPLHIAARWGSCEAVEKLLKAGAGIDKLAIGKGCFAGLNAWGIAKFYN